MPTRLMQLYGQPLEESLELWALQRIRSLHNERRSQLPRVPGGRWRKIDRPVPELSGIENGLIEQGQ